MGRRHKKIKKCKRKKQTTHAPIQAEQKKMISKFSVLTLLTIVATSTGNTADNAKITAGNAYIRHGGDLKINVPSPIPGNDVSLLYDGALGEETLAEINSFINDSGAVALVFSNSINGSMVEVPTKDFVADATSKWVLGAVTKAFGIPVGYEEIESKSTIKYIHDFSYINSSYVVEGSGVALDQQFGWHIENFAHPSIPTYVLMLCLRQDDEKIVETIFLPAPEIMKHLTEKTIIELQKPQFLLEIEDTLNLDNLTSRIIPEPIPILIAPKSADEAWSIFYDSTFMTAISADAQEALSELNRESVNWRVSAKLNRGDIIIWKNAAAAHDRR